MVLSHSAGRLQNSHGSILALGLLPLPALHALCLQIGSHAGEPLALLLQPLALDLQVGGLLRDLELVGVQFEDLGGVVGGVVLREGVAVVGAESLVGARELRQRGLEGLQVLRAELRQGGERVVDAQERGGVVGDLEVRGALRDELGSCQCTILYNAILYCDVLCCALGCCAVLFGTALRCGEGACGVWWTYSSGVFVEKHVGGGVLVVFVARVFIKILVGDGRGFVFGSLLTNLPA